MSDKAPSSVVTSLLRFMGKLPFNCVRMLGRGLGRALFRMDRRTMYAIERNLQICIPHLDQAQRAQLRLKRLAYMGQTFAEMSHMWTKDTNTLVGLCRDGEGADVFREALKGEQGVLVIAPHLGNWEILNAYICSIRPMTVMYRPQKNAALDQFILSARERSGAELAPTNRRGVMQLMKALNRGGVVGILPDQVPQQGSGEYASFFGRPAYTMTLAGQLAQKTNARVFVAAGFQVESGFEIVAQEIGEDFFNEDMLVSTTALNAAVERIVMLHPEQYQWEYKRFKTPPEGLSNPYNN